MEESIFQRNVPGKWLAHSDNGNSGRNNDVDDEVVSDRNQSTSKLSESENQGATYHHVPDVITQQILAERMSKPNTGIKSVIADRKTQQELESAEAYFQSAYRQQVLTRMVEGHKVPQIPAVDHGIGDGIEEDNDDDDDFLVEYRQKRMLELKTSKPVAVFGQCYDVDNDEFLREVETKDVIVIVHLFDPSVQSCVKMNKLLEVVAAEMNHLKFLRFNARVNDVEVDRLTLPILSFYRNGESVYVCAGIEEELGRNFTKDDVEWLIQTTLQSTVAA